MDYTIHCYVLDRWVREEAIDGRPADWVYDHAKKLVDERKADRVEVVDRRNVPVFRWPSSLHRA